MGNLKTAKGTIEILDRYHIVFQKRFGQNFLIDPHVLDKIIQAAEITKDDMVLEVGPGIGTMTQELCENAGKVVAVEIDQTLIPILEGDTLKEYDNVRVINEDILKLDINKLVQDENAGKAVKVVANLPYYITTPIIMGLLEEHVPVKSMTLMVQKEVAERMKAGPGTKDYGALSLAVQYYAKPYIAAYVPMNCFMPRPNVDSAVIHLSIYDKPSVEVTDEKQFFAVIKAAFGQRRKTLVNALTNAEALSYSKETVLNTIKELGFSETIRGEVLTIEEFAKLANALKETER